MIVHIRGTSGSGKTHMAREVMAMFEEGQPAYIEGRRRPILTQHESRVDDKPLSALGHYETACGGCDTITSMDQVFDTALQEHDIGNHVLMEGLLCAADVVRSKALFEETGKYKAYFIDIPLEKCLEQVNARRAARGKMEPVNPKNTESKWKGVQRAYDRLVEEGVPCFRGTYDEVLAQIKEDLGC